MAEEESPNDPMFTSRDLEFIWPRLEAIEMAVQSCQSGLARVTSDADIMFDRLSMLEVEMRSGAEDQPAEANQPDVGCLGDPEHRLWRASPYGSVLRRRGAWGWPRPNRHVDWAPEVGHERGTQARAELWRRPRDPG